MAKYYIVGEIFDPSNKSLGKESQVIQTQDDLPSAEEIEQLNNSFAKSAQKLMEIVLLKYTEEERERLEADDLQLTTRIIFFHRLAD